MGEPLSGAEVMVTVHEAPVILVVMELPVDDPGHQQEGPGPASPPGLMMQQLLTPEDVLCEEQAPKTPRITIVQIRMMAPISGYRTWLRGKSPGGRR